MYRLASISHITVKTCNIEGVSGVSITIIVFSGNKHRLRKWYSCTGTPGFYWDKPGSLHYSPLVNSLHYSPLVNSLHYSPLVNSLHYSPLVNCLILYLMVMLKLAIHWYNMTLWSHYALSNTSFTLTPSPLRIHSNHTAMSFCDS